MERSNGEHVGPEAIPTQPSHSFTMIGIRFLRLDACPGWVNISLIIWGCNI